MKNDLWSALEKINEHPKSSKRKMIPSLRLIRTLILVSIFFILSACEGDEASEVGDIIIVNGPAQIEFDNVVYEDTDSLRMELTKMHDLKIIKEGFLDLYVNIYPHTSMSRGDVGKYYLNMSPTDTSDFGGGFMLDRKEGQRSIKFENSGISGFRTCLVTFEDVVSFQEEIAELEREKEEEGDSGAYWHYDIWEDNDLYDFDNRHLKACLYNYGVADFLENDLLFSGYQDKGAFEKSLIIRLVVDSTGFVLIENAFTAVQFYGRWELRNEFDELYYSNPVRTYFGDYGVDKEADHGPNARGGLGAQYVISSALRASLNQMLATDTVQYYLNEEHNLFLADQQKNLEMGEISLLNNETGKTKSLEDCLESVVLIKGNNNSNFGSGSIISEDGYILTNYHVVAGIQNELSVKLNTGDSFSAKLIRKDRLLDVALLKIDKDDCVPIKLNPNYNCALGEEVYNAGTPSNVALFNSVATGNISAIREIEGVDYFQTSGNVHSGMSGGPLLNSAMEQIGVHVWGWKSGDLWLKGIEFDIPLKVVFQRLNIKF